VAQSMGGEICMGFTTQSPERVCALVMADTFGDLTLPEPYHTQQQERSEVTRGWSQLDRVASKREGPPKIESGYASVRHSGRPLVPNWFPFRSEMPCGRSSLNATSHCRRRRQSRELVSAGAL
jgi:pimeloyl-ACP methyl ester carboxylesterase